jgi:hypothetical protein
MTARVIELPTAASEPPPRPQQWRGRYPGGGVVIPQSKIRAARSCREDRAKQQQQMLAEIDRMRTAILAGSVAGVQTAMRSTTGEETIFLAGEFEGDPMAAMRAVIGAVASLVVELPDDPRGTQP